MGPYRVDEADAALVFGIKLLTQRVRGTRDEKVDAKEREESVYFGFSNNNNLRIGTKYRQASPSPALH